MGFFDKAKGAVAARKAFQTYQAAVELANKDQPEAAKEKYRSALDQYAEAVRLGGATVNALLSYSLLLTREGEFEKAKALMQQIGAIPGLPDNSRFQLRIQYSILLWKLGKLDDAIATIGRAAEKKMNGTVYGTLGMYLVDKANATGDYDEAIAFMDKALDYDDEDADTLDNVGQLKEGMSRLCAGKGEKERAEALRREAVAYYEKAHERKPRQITTIYYLARLYFEDGERAKAAALVKDADKLYYSAVCPVSREQMETLKKQIG